VSPGWIVAVLQKRGRFWAAEPLFPQGRNERDLSRARPSGGIALGAQLGRGAGSKARAGDLVLLHLAARTGRGGRPGRGGQARLVRVIGRPDVARDVIEGLMLDRGLARGFGAEVEREARQARDRGLEQGDTGRGRRDLRGLTTFTVDPITARDFDDAISAERIEDGGVRVWVHIADVSAHVPEGSLVDREARRRATSVYVPGAVEPMLPEALSNGACSLVPGHDRLAVTVELELHGAEVRRTAFYRSLISSDVRLDYERVDRIFAGQEPAGELWREPLRAAREAAAALEREREQGGALVVDSEEPEFSFDEEGNVSEVRGRVQTESHRLIEHLMIAANEAVARELQQRGVPCLYRVHERPDPERVERLIDQLASLEVPTPPLPEHVSASQAAELVGVISKRVDEHVRRTGRGRIALSSLVLRSLKQAYYSPENLGHAGLHSASYCHFTSPIRRYPDIVCHRALLSAVGGPESAPRAGELAELGAWISERERDAMTIERDGDDVACCFALEAALYEQGWDQAFAGEVIGLISAGAFVTFPAPSGTRGEEAPDGGGAHTPGVRAGPYEGMLPVRRLREISSDQAVAGEWWEINELGTILHGERVGSTLRLGDPIDVRVARVDPVRGRVDLLPAR
jgi:ribonuclease R